MNKQSEQIGDIVLSIFKLNDPLGASTSLARKGAISPADSTMTAPQIADHLALLAKDTKTAQPTA